MTIDDNVNSPFRDRIYVTWTAFAADGSAFIYEVHSDDYGETFSKPGPGERLATRTARTPSA